LDAWLPPGHPPPRNRQLGFRDRILYRIKSLKGRLREFLGLVGIRGS
jgi:hypothetical protein